MNNPAVCVCILTFNNYMDTIECVQSLRKQNFENYSIIIVNNGSTDDSINHIKNRFPNLEILDIPQNVGVPSGFNVGIQWAILHQFEYVLLLNNDTVVAPNLLSRLVYHHQNIKDCGMSMPKILFYNREHINLNNHIDKDQRKDVWSDGGYFRKFPPGIIQKDNRKTVNFNKVRQIEYAPACGLLITCNVFKKVGLFDPGYFFFFEDWDFSIRVRKAGYQIWCDPAAVLWHKVSVSTKKNHKLYWFVMGESMIRFFRRHFSLPSSFLQVTYRVLRDICIENNTKYVKHYINGIIKGLKSELGDYPFPVNHEPNKILGKEENAWNS